MDWETPVALFDELNRVYRFSLDVCATPENAKCGQFYTPQEDGLEQGWFGSVWMNPPYGKGIQAWVARAYRSRNNCRVIVALLPASTDTRWFHSYIWRKASIVYLKGRVKFTKGGKELGSPNFSSMLAIWRPDSKRVTPPEQTDLFEGGDYGF